MYQFDYQLRIRYADTDQMGYVYYGNYARFYEVGRAELFREIGFPYASLEKSGIFCPVSSMHIRYLRPCHYDEMITIRTVLKKVDSTKAIFLTEIIKENGKLANAGEVRLAFIDSQTHKSRNMPEELFNLVSKYFED